MNTTHLKDKRLAILGLGVENYWLVKWLAKHRIHCHITICDQRSQEELADKFTELNKHDQVTWQLGREYNINLDRYDILFRSPGWPVSCPGVQAGLKQNKKLILTSPMRLFFDVVPTKNIIGVTGTKGKGTTSSLIYAILKQAGKKCWLAGNIGVAPFSFIDKLTKDDFVVLELSSFQLEDLHASPHIAVLTNFSPEHLAPADPNNPNFHPSLAHYWISKFNIAKWQRVSDIFVVNEKLKSRLAKWEAKFGVLKQRVACFGLSDLPSRLPGDHNRENIAAACEVARVLKLPPEAIIKAVAKFKGLEHRIEKVREVKGASYYDDSFATTPESAIIALKSFDKPIILLAGGADKGADFAGLAKEVVKRVKYAVLFDGAATPRLKKNLLAAGYSASKIKIAKSMDEAVALAAAQAKAGDIVLLSTACASFGMFRNYKERGSLFQEAVNKLK
ncbi:MAG: UDP-N-acetylmuramoyl-L-alanine--D-glutamate ligase [Candidatus Falkowbacteria bacterium]